MKTLEMKEMEMIEGGRDGRAGEACLGGALVGFFLGGGVLGAAIGCAVGLIGNALD